MTTQNDRREFAEHHLLLAISHALDTILQPDPMIEVSSDEYAQAKTKIESQSLQTLECQILDKVLTEIESLHRSIMSSSLQEIHLIRRIST